MDRSSDTELLREYAERRSEAVFNQLVRRYVDLVYSAERRSIESPPGWLHQTARNLAANTGFQPSPGP